MKTIVRFLSVLAVMTFIIACSEDIYLHDGYSVVTKVDPVYSTDNSLIGYTTGYYKDTDWSENYTEGDEFQNSFTLFNGKDGQNGQDGKDGENSSIKLTILPPSGECSKGSVLMESYTGTTLVSSISYCLPENGYSPVMEVKEIKDQTGKVLGNQTFFYLDMDRDGKVSEGDEYMGGFICWNGVNGKSSITTFEIVDGFLIIPTIVDGEVINTVKFEMPKDGNNGISPSLETKRYEDYCGCGGAAGTMYIWYFDLNKNSVHDEGDELLSETVICDGKDGQNGENGKILVSRVFKEDFNTGSSGDAVVRGWKSKEGTIEPASGNHINAPNNEGTLVDWDFNDPRAIVWCPEFEPSVFLSLSFKVGSKNSQKIRVFVMHQDGSQEEVFSMKTNPVSGFIWYDHSTYKQVLSYNPNLSEIKYWDVIRWGILFENGEENPIPGCYQFDANCDWRNYVFNGDDFKWTILTPLE